MLLTLLVAVPLVFDPTTRPAFTLPKLTVLVVGSALVIALAAASPSRLHWRNGLHIPVLLLLGWTAVSAVTSTDPVGSLLGSRESLDGVLTAVVFALVFFAVADAFDGGDARTALSALWFGATAPVLLYGALQLAGWDPVPWVGVDDFVIWSTLGNPNDLAGFLATVLPIGVVFLAASAPLWVRAATGVMTALLVVELVVTTSRGAVAAAAVGLLTLVACLRLRVIVLLAGAAALVAVAAGLVVVAGGHTERDLGDLLRSGEGTTPALRVELWRTAWRMAEEHPVTGVGPDGFGRSFDAFKSERFVSVYGPDVLASDPHNLFLNHLATRGWPGLVALLFLLGGAFVRFWQSGRASSGDSRTLLAAVLAAVAAYVVQASFNRQDIALDFCFWVLLGLGCALRSASGAAEQGGEGDDDRQGADGEGHPGDRACSSLAIV